jgi:excisionase family DNA binding protein
VSATAEPINGTAISIRPSVPLQPLLLKPAEAAKLLAVSERTLWGLAARAEIRVVRIGRSTRYLLADLQAMCERLANVK